MVGDDEERKSKAHRRGCPFKLNCWEEPRDVWQFVVECGIHNHKFPSSLEGHAFAGMLSRNELKVVRQMSDTAPKDILMILRGESCTNVTCRQHIYNARAKLTRDLMNGLSSIQYLYKMLPEKEYIFDYRLTPDGGLLNLTFAHHDSVKMWEKFPYVMIMDITYNTNI